MDNTAAGMIMIMIPFGFFMLWVGLQMGNPKLAALTETQNRRLAGSLPWVIVLNIVLLSILFAPAFRPQWFHTPPPRPPRLVPSTPPVVAPPVSLPEGYVEGR